MNPFFSSPLQNLIFSFKKGKKIIEVKNSKAILHLPLKWKKD